MTRRLVFGDDQSQAADVAWLWINSHDWPGWQIEALTATPAGQAQDTEVHAWGARHPRELLREWTQTPVHHEQIIGDPMRTLTGLRDRDLLVVGPKGRGFRKTLHLGSTTDALLNEPPMPLVIARHGVPTRRALVCADGSADCHAAVEAMRAMPWLGQVQVLVVSVPHSGFDAQSAAERVAEILRPDARSVRVEVPPPDELQITVDTRVVLLEAAEWWQADLVVLGTRGLSGFAAVRAGSIATSLATNATCSVLMARAT
ncbi:MAG: universal stress protein [Actinomycetota bacterium]|nr:universal stress protein [Actinomycetota bacterium]